MGLSCIEVTRALCGQEATLAGGAGRQKQRSRGLRQVAGTRLVGLSLALTPYSLCSILSAEFVYLLEQIRVILAGAADLCRERASFTEKGKQRDDTSLLVH